MTLNISNALSQNVVDKRVDVLRKIKQCGSISEAARSAGISYKAAWQAIENMSALAGVPLVEKIVGGSSGGGARLTEAGESVLEAAAALSKLRDQLIIDIENKGSSGLAALAANTLKMSIRNIIPCVVEDMHGGMSMTKVKLKICEGEYLRSCITIESRELLDLKTGDKILALFKASGATINLDPEAEPKSCCLKGQVVRLPPKEKGGEVTIRLPNGFNVVGFAHKSNGLSVGSDAYAHIPEQAVVLALFG